VNEVDYLARNRESRERLAAVIERLGVRTVVLPDGWTAAAVLAHLAFWDRVAAGRIEKFLRHGKPLEFFNDVFFEYINEAGLPQWTRTPLPFAAADATEAALASDGFIEGLSAEDVSALLAAGPRRMLYRFPHRDEHLDQIERALA
jgi:hypothetical protein